MALPGDFRSFELDYFKKLLVIRALRPDRMTTALTKFFTKELPNGEAFTQCDAALSNLGILESAYEDASATVPMYLILSPGANPVKDVEDLQKNQEKAMKMKITIHWVSMGQGQETNAFNRLQ